MYGQDREMRVNLMVQADRANVGDRADSGVSEYLLDFTRGPEAVLVRQQPTTAAYLVVGEVAPTGFADLVVER